MKIGVIGVGNMGRILTEALLDVGTVSPSEVNIVNRTKKKAVELKNIYKEINVADCGKEVAILSDLIFICVKPMDVYDVVSEIQPYLTESKCLVSITSPISVEQLETLVNCSVARVIPSITNRAHAGVSLITFGEHCHPEWKTKVKNIFQHISVPIEIDHNVTRVASDITSCGPAFFSYLTQRFISAAVKETEIDYQTATKLTSEMIIGLAELLKKDYYTLESLQEKVCVKGGITGEGIKVFEEELGEVFEHLFNATHNKFRDEMEKIKKHFPL